MYRLIVESLLGIRREGTTLRLDPRLPADWPAFRFTYRYGATVYRFSVVVDANADENASGRVVSLVDDGQEHAIEILVAPRAPVATVPSVR
jgi:cellobiose phosphorylase